MPKNTIVVNGVDLAVRFQMVLLDGYTLSPPEPKVYKLDIPGADGSIDLTTALTGDVAYNNRKQEFTFLVIEPKDFESVKTQVSNFLHGKLFDYSMTMDPEYTYHGLFKVESYQHSYYSSPGLVGAIKISIDADPYKFKKRKIYSLNAAGGNSYRFESGRKPVRPLIETKATVYVNFKGVEYTVPAGKWRLNNVIFTEGENELYINSFRRSNVTWADLGVGGQYAATWDDITGSMWDEVMRVVGKENARPQQWSELYGHSWSEYAKTKWIDMNYFPDNCDIKDSDYIVKIAYDWKDL